MAEKRRKDDSEEQGDSEEQDEGDSEEHVETSPDAPVEKSKGLTPGIVYLSRIPPYMKPAKVRHLFSRHGVVGRVYLQPEGKAQHSFALLVHGRSKLLFKTEQCRLVSLCL